jgi:hypothetical protein
LVEAVGSLHFAGNNPNPMVGMGSLSEDGNLVGILEPDDLNVSLEMVNITQDGSDRIEMIDR